MSRASFRPPPQKSTKEPTHLPLHRRLLFPTLPPDSPIPPLIPGDQPDIVILNERLYNFIALCLRAYVLSWLPRITRDRSLLPHIHTQIIAPILLPIFTHLSTHPDALIPLLLYDLPGVLTLHVKTYWQARQTVHIIPNSISLDGTYHAHLPLLSTTPSPTTITEPERSIILEGQYVVSGLWLTSLIDALIKKSLKEEDYRVTVQRTMVREIIGRTILGSVARKIGDPSFWWGLILRFMPLSKPKKALKVDVWERALDMIRLVIGLIFKMWTVGVRMMATLTDAPKGQYGQVTDSWAELLREVLNVDGRLGRRNWALRILWGIFEGILWLFSPFTDQLIPHLLRLYLLTPKSAIWTVDLLERILFPLDGYPAPTPPDPTPEETAAMRRMIEERMSQLLPAMSRRVIAPNHTDLQALLDPLSDPGCNAHLIGMLYTTVFGALAPELVVNKPEDIPPLHTCSQL